MNKGELDALVNSIKGIHAAAWCGVTGVVRDESSNFDGDVPCAVATISNSQLEELGQILGAGPLRDWSITTSALTLYVLRRHDASFVALGEPYERAAAVARKLEEAIDLEAKLVDPLGELELISSPLADEAVTTIPPAGP